MVVETPTTLEAQGLQLKMSIFASVVSLMCTDPAQMNKVKVKPNGAFYSVVVLFRQNPQWGAANVPYSRWLPPEYEDQWGTPRGWDPEHSYHNASLPPVQLPAGTFDPPLTCQPL